MRVSLRRTADGDERRALRRQQQGAAAERDK
jgi:hypothetical protein